MKIISLRKKVIARAIIAFVLIVINVATFLFHKNIKENANQEITKLGKETSSIQSRIQEITSKEAEIKKYKVLWQALDDKYKNLNGVKADDFNKKLEEISKKYLVKTSDVKINLPEILSDPIFKRETFHIYFTSVSLKYSAINDISAIAFINEFINSLNGYTITTYFDINKVKDYKEQDFIDISYGRVNGGISGRLEFFWYVPKSL